MRFYLVRHATTRGNVEGLLYGALDLPLTELGREEAQGMRAWFDAHPTGEIYTSDSQRTIETASLVFGDRPFSVTKALRCLDFGELEGRTFCDVQQSHPDLARTWVDDFASLAFPGGESMEGFRERITGAWSELYARHSAGDADVALVLHGGPIRVILFEVLGVPLRNFYRLQVPTASVTIIEAVSDYCTVTCAGAKISDLCTAVSSASATVSAPATIARSAGATASAPATIARSAGMKFSADSA